MSNIVSSKEVSAHELALVQNDLSKLNPQERLSLYRKTCESLGLNELTQPFGYIEFRGGKLSLYAKKDCTDQLRKIHGVSVEIVSKEILEGNYVVIARAKDQSGRTDEDMGSVSIKGLQGEALGNAMMKAITKAKRRVTLSICGLGILDETETETVPGLRIVEENTTPPQTGSSQTERHQPAGEGPKPIVNHAPVQEPLNIDNYALDFNFGTFKSGTKIASIKISDLKNLQTAVMSWALKMDGEGKPVPPPIQRFIEVSKLYLESKENV